MKVLYSIAVTLLIVLFFTRCDQLRVFDDRSGGPSNKADGKSGGAYGTDTDDEYADGKGSGKGYTDYSGNGGGDANNDDDDEIYCPAGEEDCDDDLFDSDYSELEDEYDGAGARVDFTSKNTMQEYRIGKRANHPIDKGRVYVSMNREGNHRYYSGEISIAFKLRNAEGKNRVWVQNFRSGWGEDNRYNVWAKFGGKLGFHAFFYDSWKGVILVIDEIKNITGEKTDQNKVNLKSQLGSGSVWFRPFRAYDNRGNHDDCYEGGKYIGMGEPTSPPPPSRRCWFVEIGPYSCQAWESGGKVRTFTALRPDNESCYKKLGDFKNLNISEAFDTDDGDVYITTPWW